MPIRSVYVWFEFPSTQNTSFITIKMPRNMTDLMRLRGFIREYKAWFKQFEDQLLLELGLQRKVSKRHAAIAEIRLIGTEKDTILLKIPVVPSAVTYYVDNARNRFKHVLEKNSIVLPRRPERIFLVPPDNLRYIMEELRTAKDTIANTNKLLSQVVERVVEKIEELLNKYNIETQWENIREELLSFKYHEPRLTIIPVVIDENVAKQLSIDKETLKEIVRQYHVEVARAIAAEIKEYIVAIRQGKRPRNKSLLEKLEKIAEMSKKVGIDVDPVISYAKELISNPEKIRQVQVDAVEEEILARL